MVVALDRPGRGWRALYNLFVDQHRARGRQPVDLGDDDSEQLLDALTADDRRLSIDLRSADVDLAGNDVLYGIAESGTLYQRTAEGEASSTVEAEAVASLNDGASTSEDVELSGTRFAIDFNPRANRLRLVSNVGQSLRINVENGVTVIDKPLRLLLAEA